MDLQIGSTVGDYQVVGILGAGGMGKVYKVRNVISDRLEAMKVLLPDLANAPELADRFLREIKVQASLVHPNIAALHTAVRQDNQLLMLMEFVDGVTLEQRLKQQGPLSVAEAIEYVRQVLSALEYAHQHGVIHRDIKPANMMLTPNGTVKLMDFGIAKDASDHKLTMTGTTMGSLYYMSPEQIQGASNIDARADLYSVGVSLYELLTGKRPFDGDSQFAIMSAHLEKTPIPPITLDPRMPQMLNDIILMSVAKTADGRFQTAGAFRNALGAVVGAPAPAAAPAAQPAPAARPPVQAAAPPAPAATLPMPPPSTAQPKSKRGIWMAIGAIAAVGVLVAAVQFGPWKGSKAAVAPPSTPPVTTANPAPDTAAPAAPAPVPGPTVPEPATQTPAASQKPVEAVSQRPVETAPQPSKPRVTSSAAKPPATQPQPQQPLQAPPVQTPTQQPVQTTPQAPAQQPPAAPVESGPSRAELQKMRESLALMNNRANQVRTGIENLRRSQAAQGFNIGSQYTGPAGLMDTFLNGANEALNAHDLTAAKDFAAKAEHQLEILEKLLHL